MIQKSFYIFLCKRKVIERLSFKGNYKFVHWHKIIYMTNAILFLFTYGNKGYLRSESHICFIRNYYGSFQCDGRSDSLHRENYLLHRSHHHMQCEQLQ